MSIDPYSISIHEPKNNNNYQEKNFNYGKIFTKTKRQKVI